MLGVRTSSAVGGGSIRWNNYAYAGSNPVNYLDPSGKFFFGAIIGGLIGGGIDLLTQVVSGKADCIDWGSVGWSALEGAIGGALNLNMVGDFLVGMSIDLFGRGESLETALMGGLFGAGVGRLFGGGKHVDDVGGRLGRQADSIDPNVKMRGDGDVPTVRGAGDSSDDWVDKLIKDRRIAKPDGVEFDANAVGAVQARLKARLNGRTDLEMHPRFKGDVEAMVDGQNVAILEADGNWYLGMNRQLDQNVQRAVEPSRPNWEMPNWATSEHAELKAIVEYDNTTTIRGSNGRMWVTSEPCTGCAGKSRISPFDGRIRQGIDATNMNSLEINYLKLDTEPNHLPNPFTVRR